MHIMKGFSCPQVPCCQGVSYTSWLPVPAAHQIHTYRKSATFHTDTVNADAVKPAAAAPFLLRKELLILQAHSD